MAWPQDDLTTDAFDDATRSPAEARPMLATLITRVKGMIAARGCADGVAPLDGVLKVPPANLPAAQPGTPGIIQLATNEQIAARSNVAAAVQPAQIPPNQVILLEGSFSKSIDNDVGCPFRPFAKHGHGVATFDGITIRLVGGDYYSVLFDVREVYTISQINYYFRAAGSDGAELLWRPLARDVVFFMLRAPTDGVVKFGVDTGWALSASAQITHYP